MSTRREAAAGRSTEGAMIEDIPFTPESVLNYTDNDNTRAGAKACFKFA
jgi:hypothetical protein